MNDRPRDRHGVVPSQTSAAAPLDRTNDASKSARMRIVAQYARRQRNGRVLFCSPSKAELGGEMPRRETSGSDGKVVFPDLETAEAAARELEALGGGPQRAYICRRSRHGHAHLTSMPWGAGAEAVSVTPKEVLAYYDDPANARAMCDLLMKAHPGWTVQRHQRGPEGLVGPVWCARHESWASSHEPLINENAGLLNLAMTSLSQAGEAP